MNTAKCAALILTLLAAGTAHGQVLFTNFGANQTYGTNRWEVSSGVCSLNAIGVRFTPSQSALFADAKVALAHSPFDGTDVNGVSHSPGPNQVTIELRTDAGGVPGTILETFSATGMPEATDGGAVITVTSATHPALAAGTFYWLVLSTVDPTTCIFWYWNSTGDLADGTNIALAYSGSPNGPWQVPASSDPRPAFQIDGTPNTISTTLDGPYQVRYASNLTIGDSVVNITNTGANGNSLFGPGFGDPVGNICVNVYAFSPDEQMISCCSCLVTPNGLVHVTANNDLVSNTLTGVRPNSIVIKLVATGTGRKYVRSGDVGSYAPTFDGSSCTNSAALAGSQFPVADAGLVAWGTTLHSMSNNDPPTGPASSFSITEAPFLPASLGKTEIELGQGHSELASLANRCANITGNGSSFGICRSCRLGGLGGAKQ